MREPTIARNYAEALFEAGERVEETARFADLLDALAGAIEADDQIRMALESPRVPKATKAAVLRRALSTYAPETFLSFIGAVVKRGRQGILPQISRQYQGLVDVKFNRVHAGVVLAHEPDGALKEEIRRKLSEILEKEVVPHFRLDRAILGGVIVRVGDQVMDGSLRRKLVRLRKQMMGA